MKVKPRIISIKERPQQTALKTIISLGDQEKGKDGKSRKSRKEEKVMGFSSASLFPARKREAVTQGGTMNPRGSSKAGTTSETAGAFQIH